MRLADGLHRVGNDIVACYLVADDSGITLIDAGISGQWPDLLAELAAMGRTVADLRGVVLTHGDEDHIGFAERLRSEHGVPVWVHEADAGRARGEGKPATGFGRFRLGPLLGFLWYAGRRGGLKTTYLSQVETFTGGETLEVTVETLDTLSDTIDLADGVLGATVAALDSVGVTLEALVAAWQHVAQLRVLAPLAQVLLDELHGLLLAGLHLEHLAVLRQRLAFVCFP